jgi:hypothetical protein
VNGATIPIVLLLIVASRVWSQPSAAEDQIQKTSGLGQQEPAAATRGLVARVQDLEREIALLKRTSPPIGSVSAYPGRWPDDLGRAAFEEKMGWMLCDGRKLPLADPRYQALSAALKRDEQSYIYGGTETDGFFQIPDYRGYFLRGTAHGSMIDPERDKRTGGDVVGSHQGWATALAQNGFKTGKPSEALSYSEAFELYEHLYVHGPGGGENSATCVRFRISKVSGADHVHEISGGDAETRPVNRAVEWIIKYR